VTLPPGGAHVRVQVYFDFAGMPHFAAYAGGLGTLADAAVAAVAEFAPIRPASMVPRFSRYRRSPSRSNSDNDSHAARSALGHSPGQMTISPPIESRHRSGQGH